jgi:glycosyltransferase involved in cell wall biosynthesis
MMAMNHHPQVSVLVPCYNAEKYIGETLESILRQTWSNVEIVVVDDGSEDGSVATVRQLSGKRVRLIRQANAGAAAARNVAFAASHGDFVQFLDADDIIDPDKIELQMIRLADYPRCVASAEWGRFSGSLDQTKFNEERVWLDLDPLDWLALSYADGPGMMFPALWLIPRSIANSAGPWDETLSLGDDGEYFTRVLLAAEQVLFCRGARCRYRSRLPNSLSRGKSVAALTSQYRAAELCEAHVRAREDSERVRRGFALCWQHFAHASYPYCRDLAECALQRARALHPIRIRPDGGPTFHVAMRLMGWRLARRLQVASGRP